VCYFPKIIIEYEICKAQDDAMIFLQACVRLMPSTMLYSGQSADETHLIVSTEAL